MENKTQKFEMEVQNDGFTYDPTYDTLHRLKDRDFIIDLACEIMVYRDIITEEEIFE